MLALALAATGFGGVRITTFAKPTLAVSSGPRCRTFAPPTLAVSSPRSSRVACQAVADRELEALFYSFDDDSNGEIDREELEKALGSLDYAMTTSEITDLFQEIDVDRNGSISLQEFKRLVGRLGLTPDKNIWFAMKLFAKYDEDGSGVIDKGEFRALAREIQVESDRRKFLQIASAVAGSLIVSQFSAEFQWAQKSFRSLYVEQRAEASQSKIFPTAMLSSDFDHAVARTLSRRGFTATNTLFAHSVCSDEVNHKDEVRSSPPWLSSRHGSPADGSHAEGLRTCQTPPLCR